MIDSLLKFVAPTGLGVVSFGSLIIYSHLSLPKPPTQTEGNNNTKQTLEQDAEQNEPEQSLIATITENQETDVVTPITDEKIDTSNQSTDTEESEKLPVETTAIETLEEEVLTTIEYDEKYKEIIENSDYFYNQEYKTKDLSEDEIAKVDEIKKLYSDYSQINHKFRKQPNTQNIKLLVKNIGGDFVEFPNKSKGYRMMMSNFDIITSTKQGKDSKNSEQYFYSIKFNSSDEWETISGSQEFVNEWGSKITEANKKLFDKVLEYKLNNKSKLDEEIIDKYKKCKEDIVSKKNILKFASDFMYNFHYMHTNLKGKYDEESQQLLEKTLKDYKNWHIEASTEKIKYGYFLMYLYHFWLQENSDKKILKDVDLNAEFAKIDQLTSNKFKNSEILNKKIYKTITTWVINYLSNPDKEKEWKTEEFKNVRDTIDILSIKIKKIKIEI